MTQEPHHKSPLYVQPEKPENRLDCVALNRRLAEIPIHKIFIHRYDSDAVMMVSGGQMVMSDIADMSVLTFVPVDDELHIIVREPVATQLLGELKG